MSIFLSRALSCCFTVPDDIAEDTCNRSSLLSSSA